MDYEILSENIGIKTAIPFLTLTEMEIQHEINEHGTVRLQAVVSEENQEEVCNKDWTNTWISVYEKGERDIPLFNGRVDKLTCYAEGKVLRIVIEGISETIRLDRKKKKRSFQNSEMTYEHIVEEIIKEYADTDYIWCVENSKKIENPIIQYEETDWEFLKRIGSHMNVSLVPELRSEKLYCLFGISKGTQQVLEEARAEVIGIGFDDSYYQNGCYERGIPISQMMHLIVKTKKNWQMWDWIEYERQYYRVYKRSMILKNGELVYIYSLGTEGVYYQKQRDNPAIAGVRLEGTVRKTQGESVYLQLDIDKKECADYPWVWAPETNNLCYCMPEVGTKATLYFPTGKEKDGVVLLAAVKNEKNDRYVDTQKREFATSYQKKIGLYPDKLLVEGMNSLIHISLDDDNGIQLGSNKEITLLAENEIRLQGDEIVITAPLEVVCRTQVSNIELCRDINMYAPGGVKTVGIEDTSAIQNSNMVAGRKEKREECWQAAYTALAAIPSADFSNMEDAESAFDLYMAGSIPKVANGATAIALSEVMEGNQMEATASANVFQTMENYTVKGGYALPEE